MLSPAGAVAPHHHAVTFYDNEVELLAQLVEFVADGLRHGEGAVVVATPDHRSWLVQALVQRGLGAADLAGNLLVVDAAVTLASIRVDGELDAGRFDEVVGGLLDRAAGAGRPVRAFGEMVALLWAQGDVVGALDLESRWNALAQVREFRLLCAYPAGSIAEPGDLGLLAQVCRQHSDLRAPGSYGSDVDVPGRAAGSDTRAETFVPVPEAVRRVRRFVTGALHAWNHESLVADVQLVVSELATNALRHASSPFRVQLSRVTGRVRVGVEDVGAGAPALLPPSPDRLSGRGVALVDALSDRWGVDADDRCKVVWAEFSTL